MKKNVFFILLFYMHILSFSQEKNPYKKFTSSPKTLMLNYDDFGPQVLCYNLIGFQWWQWDNHGDSNPKKTYDIRVIVYKNRSLTKVKKKYPIQKECKLDFRYVHYNKVVTYLSDIIEENKENNIVKKHVGLKERIIAHFASNK